MNFTQAVARAVYSIPRGKVASYGAVARAAGSPGAARAVASALRAGPRGLPWQRVLGAGGRILLRGEAGLEQRMRLQGEGVEFQRGRVARRHLLPAVKVKPARRARGEGGPKRTPHRR